MWTKEQQQASQRKWNLANPDKLRAIKARCNKKNRHKYNVVERAWRARNKTKVAGYSFARLMKTYGLSVAEFNRILEAQNHCCAICSRKQRRRRLSVDHDHATGFVRAILCGPCNTALGGFQDSPELLRKAATYIEIATAAQGVM